MSLCVLHAFTFCISIFNALTAGHSYVDTAGRMFSLTDLSNCAVVQVKTLDFSFFLTVAANLGFKPNCSSYDTLRLNCRMFQIMLIYIGIPALLIFNFLLCKLPFGYSIYKEALNETKTWPKTLCGTCICMQSLILQDTHSACKSETDLVSMLRNKKIIRHFQDCAFSCLLCVNW